MSTNILITIGKNELPCLVAAYRLCRHYEGRDPRLIFIYSKAEDYRRLWDVLKKRLDAEGFEIPEPHGIEVKSPFDPQSIRNQVASSNFLGSDEAANCLHLHYTGGTKAMALHTLQALLRFVKAPVETSYLAPDQHRIMTPGGYLSDEPKDERLEWAGKIGIDDLGRMRGFDKVTWNESGDSWLPLANALMDLHVQNPKVIEKWPRKDWLREPKEDKVSRELWQVADRERRSLEGDDKSLLKLFDYGFFEAIVYRAMKEILTGRDCPVYHSVRFQETGGDRKNFEVDVVALIGYHVVAFTCTCDDGEKNEKLKGFEIIHRSRQFGGDHAHPILVLGGSECGEDRRRTMEMDINGTIGDELRRIHVLARPSFVAGGKFDFQKLIGDLRKHGKDNGLW